MLFIIIRKKFQLHYILINLFDIQTNGVSMPAIMTFLWDSDPIGSRGTETQVQG
jgi:hypothetical protein